MAKTILEITQAVTAELQLPVPTVALTSDDLTVKQLIAIIKAACDELVDDFDWQQLLTTHIITTSAGQDLYSLPADVQRVISDTSWDRTNRWPLSGSLNPQEFQTLQSGITVVAPHTRFRVIGDRVQVLPVPGATPQTFALNYITRNYVIDAMGARKGDFTADSDRVVFRDRLIINFAKLKLLQTKGFDTSAAAADFNNSYAAAVGGDVPVGGLQMTHSMAHMPHSNVPEGNWG